MPRTCRWRLSVRLKDGTYAQTAVLDFLHRETIDAQVAQLLFGQNDYNSKGLFEFVNELGELLAFRAFAYRSHEVTPIDTLATAV